LEVHGPRKESWNDETRQEHRCADRQEQVIDVCPKGLQLAGILNGDDNPERQNSHRQSDDDDPQRQQQRAELFEDQVGKHG
jgi:hypothetical protein